jgi:hypothetical protein
MVGFSGDRRKPVFTGTTLCNLVNWNGEGGSTNTCVELRIIGYFVATNNTGYL